MDEKQKPKVVCLCGSTRFKDEFVKANERLTLAGKVVLTVGLFTHADKRTEITPAIKRRLDELHKRKIDMADYVYVINVGGYIGESTKSEIEYAENAGKPIQFLEY